MNKKFSIIIFLAVALIAFLMIYVSYLKKDQRLRDRFKVETALLDSVIWFPRGSGVYVYYRYEVSAKKYREKQRLFVDVDSLIFLKRLLLNRQIPIVYDSLEPSNSEVLLSSKDFARYRIRRVDSLSAVVQVIDSLRY